MTSWLFYKSKKIDLNKNTISDLGGDKNTSSLFKANLIIFSVVQVFFSFIVLYELTGSINSTMMLYFVIGGTFLVLVGLFTTNKYPTIHKLFAMASAFFVGVGIITLSLYLVDNNLYLGYLAITASILIPLSYLTRNKLKGALWEIILFGGVALWNVIFSIAILS